MVKIVVKRLHPGLMWRKREGGEMENEGRGRGK